jgi:mono/diheme cytochrome c family protein
MLQRTIWAALFAAVAAAGVYWWLSAPVVAAVGPGPAHVPDLANGEVIFNAGGCASCHAVPDQPDRLRLGGGVAIKSPFGTFYAPNISPDPTYGIGKWSEADFVNAVMRGVSPGGQHYFPAFPYTSYQHAKREDVLDLFAYLKTLPAVAGKARDHDVPFPFDIRRNIGIWKFLFMDGKPFVADGTKSPQ